MNTKHDSWANDKTDLDLVDVLQTGDSQERDLAMQILHERYQAIIVRDLSQKLPGGWVEEVAQDIWVAFYKYVKVRKIKEGVAQLLRTIARNMRADAVGKLTRERLLEVDVPLTDLANRAFSENTEDDSDKLQFLQQLPFMDSPLSDCERVFWILRERLNYAQTIVARLTGKNTQTIYASLSFARKRARKYITSQGYQINLDYQEVPDSEHLVSFRENRFIVDRFAHAMHPTFTTEELRPLGINSFEYENNFVASLAISWPGKELVVSPHNNAQINSDSITLILTRKSYWEARILWLDMIRKYTKPTKSRLSSDDRELFDSLLAGFLHYTVGFDTLISVRVDNGHIILTPLYNLLFMPNTTRMTINPNDSSGGNIVFHTTSQSPKIILPITVGMLSEANLRAINFDDIASVFGSSSVLNYLRGLDKKLGGA